MRALPRGLYAITPEEPDTDLLLMLVRAALAGGAAAVQYRSKDASRALRRDQARALAELCRAHRAPLIVNDDVDTANEAGADGVHLGTDDGDLVAARRQLGPDKLLGASCYDRLDLALAAKEAGADYVAFGSVFASPTKPGAVRAPLALFAEARRAVGLPLVAIGGITPANAHLVIAAGADALAVISAVFAAPDVTARASEFQRLFERPSP
jgi:thiamine-phosphate pyrophosphorylase